MTKNINNLNTLQLQMIKMNEIRSIEDSKAWTRLQEKTQVLVPLNGRVDVVNNRQSHTLRVVTSAEFMLAKLSMDFDLKDKYEIDYNYSLEQIVRCHDIGHSCLGHDGAKMLGKLLREKGLEEGFDDNNNNLVIMEAQNLELRDSVIVGTIKYPHKLYDYQKEKYLDKLKEHIQEDKIYFKETIGVDLKDQTRTMACQIMDEADRNTYTCDDMADYFCLGNTLTLKNALKFIDQHNETQLTLLDNMITAIRSDSKTKIRTYFNNLKEQFNSNFTITENGITVVNEDIFKFREILSKMTYDLYIKPIRTEEFHLDNVERFKLFANHCFDGEYTESTFYNKIIQNTNNEKTKLRAIRDMIAEVSDWYLINYTNQLSNDMLNVNHKVLTNKKLKSN